MRINARLFFPPQIELFEFKGEDLTDEEDGGIIRRIRKKGEGYSKPNEDALVESKCVVTQIGEGFAVWDGRTFSQPTAACPEGEEYVASLFCTK